MNITFFRFNSSVHYLSIMSVYSSKDVEQVHKSDDQWIKHWAWMDIPWAYKLDVFKDEIGEEDGESSSNNIHKQTKKGRTLVLLLEFAHIATQPSLNKQIFIIVFVHHFNSNFIAHKHIQINMYYINLSIYLYWADS